MPSLHLREIRFHRFDMSTRFPFRYGIAAMTDIPHLFVAATVQIDGQLARGLSAEGLPPKWFTKHPETTFEDDDLPQMLRVIRQAADRGREVGLQPSFFTWWRALYEAQLKWAHQHDVAPLLAGLGTSLVERAVLDAWCRHTGTSLFRALRDNSLALDLAELRPELKSFAWENAIAWTPRPRVHVRHTVGLGDPIREPLSADCPRPDDPLPFTLEENIRAYGLRFFKIKLSGRFAHDQSRLVEIATLLDELVPGAAQITLDGNENFSTITDFRATWNELNECSHLRDFFHRCLIFVEQPVHRSNALDASVADELREWPAAPPILIDESDADLSSLPRALTLGYSGTSHKNCKGIIKGLVNAATIRSQTQANRRLILSAEDLGNVGPVALLQDLAMVAALGIDHVERNGHHYFAGLSMFPRSIQDAVLADHHDLYDNRHGFAALTPCDGTLSLNTVNRAPFGLLPEISMEPFAEWIW